MAAKPMDIYLLRHGIAEEAPAGMPDSGRKLTREGREKLRRILKRAHEAGVSPALILSSPYRRALETAQEASEQLDYRGDVVQTSALVPNANPAATWDEIRSHNGADAILLASHEPLMSSLLAYLLGVPALQTDFKKGALARVTCASTGPVPRGELKWMLTPALA
jgi:phosphohistidine phosphatase